ncbi:MAG TPA: hypothetical protein VIK33_12660 [Anaerolineae bacterium]
MTASPANTIIRRDPWQSLWRFVAQDRLLASELTGLAMLLALAATLPQAPHGDAAAYSRWLSDTQSRFGSLTTVLTTLGLFDIVHSILFRAVAGLLGLTLVARLIDRLVEFRAASRLADPPDTAHALSVERPPAEIVRKLRGYRVRQLDAPTLLLDRFPRAHLGSIAAYTGALIVLIGLALSTLTDWRVDRLNALPDIPTPILNTPYTLTSRIDAAGQIDVTLAQAGAPIAQGVIAPGRPLITRAASVFVRELLPALRVKAHGIGGQPLKLQNSAQSTPTDELLFTFDENRREAFFAAPDAQMAVRVSLEEVNGEPRAYTVSIVSIPDAETILTAPLAPGQVIDANGNRFQFIGESHAVLAVVYAPSQIVTLGGLIVSIVGLASTAFYRPRRIWLITQEAGTRLACDDPDFDLARLAGAER